MPVPLDLFGEVTTASGTRFRWGANQPAENRPRNLSFRTKIGEGFSDASLQLARRIDLDYADLELVNDVVLTGADGSVAYEGRIAAMPRELGDSHSIGVTLAGWMAHARDRPFTEIYVDRDLGSWGDVSRARRVDLLGANFTPSDSSTATDPSTSSTIIRTGWTGPWASPFKPVSEAWYDAGATNSVRAVGYGWARESANVNNADANWQWAIYVASDDRATASDTTGTLRAAGPATGQLFTSPTARRYAMLQLQYGSSPAGADNASYAVNWSKVAVYGDHGLTLQVGEPGEPGGVLASDVLTNITRRFCPALNTAGVVQSTYVIQHLAFKDLTDPYEAFLEVNKFHLWHLGVWEDRTLHFRPYNLTDYNWEIRTDDPGTTFAPQGISDSDLFNGIVVTYTNVLSGVVDTITPDQNSLLADTTVDNPWNKAKLDHWAKVQLSSPTLPNQAVQIARAVLGQNNTPKAPGTITVAGYIRDRQGNEQPVWKVRAGDTIAITNFPNDKPRLIHETNFDDETKTVSISVDAPAQTLDAYFDRLSSALTAKGLNT